MIRDATLEDAKAIADIYAHYVNTTVITFEEIAPHPQEMSNRIEAVLSSGHCWLVMEVAGIVVGYAYSTKWRERSAYRSSVEVSVYLHYGEHKQGFGSQLYVALFKKLSEQKRHVVIGGITLPNEASIAIHEKFGMKKVAHFSQVGNKFNQWLDVGYWQVILDDKS